MIMDKYFILASHGKFAEGLYNTLQFIMGKQENIMTICAYIDDDDIEKKIDKTITELTDKNCDIIVLTDVYGGSINNIFLKYVERPNIHLVSGTNLPLIMDMLFNQNMETDEMIKKAIESASKAIIYCKNIDYSKQDEDF